MTERVVIVGWFACASRYAARTSGAYCDGFHIRGLWVKTWIDVAPISTPASSEGTSLPPPRTCAPMFITVKLPLPQHTHVRTHMADSFTPAARALIAKKVLAHVASLDPDGAPYVTPVWVELDGDDIVINTALGRAKARNLASDARVAVSIIDPDDDHGCIAVRGTVVGLHHDGADEVIDRFAKKYMDVDSYPVRREGEVRVTVRIRPTASRCSPS